jgi:hypothetical protein
MSASDLRRFLDVCGAGDVKSWTVDSGDVVAGGCGTSIKGSDHQSKSNTGEADGSAAWSMSALHRGLDSSRSELSDESNKELL